VATPGSRHVPRRRCSSARILAMDTSEPSPVVDRVLSSSVFDVYDELLVPLIFQGYADDLARRLADLRAGSILEVAAGTGAVTRAMAGALPDDIAITATDLVSGMIERASRVGTARPVTWEHADALALPYEPESFDVVVCQFGVMFLEPKRDAFAEARRVLRPGGRLLFSVWDGLEHNEFAAVVNAAVLRQFPDDPPRFLEQWPYSYHAREVILADLRAAGFEAQPAIERVERVSRAETPVVVAAAFCGGTPLRDQIEGRGPNRLADAIGSAGRALAECHGAEDLEGRICAHVVEVVR
jgi:SAM-dependent methyltransferase